MTRVALFSVFCLTVSACTPAVSEKDTATARIRYELGINALNAGDLRTALRELLGAVELDPYQANTQNALGLVLHASGRHEDALEHYDQAVALNPGFSEAHNNRGVLLRDMKRYPEAVEAFQKALSDILYATPSLAEGNLGWTHFQNGDATKGVRHIRNAIATNPRFCQGYGWLAEISLATDKPDQAIAYCKRFTKHCVEDEETADRIPDAFVRQMQFQLGRAYLAQGDKGRAREALDACVAAGSESDVAVKCAGLRGTIH
jgi:type IV pilus biogenesis/stability protein PilW